MLMNTWVRLRLPRRSSHHLVGDIENALLDLLVNLAGGVDEGLHAKNGMKCIK